MATGPAGPIKNLKCVKIPFWAYFGPFSGSKRLIFTHPTSHWSNIIPVGSDTSVGTFHGTTRSDRKPCKASERLRRWLSWPHQASSVGPTTVPAGPKGLPALSEGPDVLTSK